MTSWTIQSRWVKAEVQSLGAMLGPAWFSLGDRQIQPLAIAPWAEEVGPEYEKLPPMLRRLRGEWPCVPFGIPERRPDLPPEWMPDESAYRGYDYIDPYPHGFSSNAEWTLMRLEPERIALSLDYPQSHPIRRVTRTVTASTDIPALEISLAIEVREACDLPIGVHPVLRLPEKPRAARLSFGAEARAWTSPTAHEPGISTFKPNIRGVPLTTVPCILTQERSETENVARLPLDCDTEELLLIVGHRGTAVLTNDDEAYSVCVAWDPKIFPACLLWLSNRGRGYFPWNHRFLGLGVEPVRSAFDLGARVSQSRSNPLWRAGVPCAYGFSTSQKLETAYTITVAETCTTGDSDGEGDE